MAITDHMSEENKARFNGAVNAYTDALNLTVQAHRGLENAATELEAVFSVLKLTEQQRERVKSLLDTGFVVAA